MIQNINIFDNYIGLEQVANTALDQVNSLGLTDETIRFVALERNGIIADVWDEVKREGINFVESELMGCIVKNADYEGDSVKTLDPDIIINPLKTSGINGVIGAVVGCGGLNGSKLIFKSLILISDRVYSTNVKIYNLDTGLEVFTAVANLVVGVNRIAITFSDDIAFGKSAFFVGVEAVLPIELTQLEGNLTNDYSLTMTNANIGNGNPKTRANITKLDSCFVHVDCVVSYNFENVMIESADLLANGFKYICGALIVERALSSKRADRESLINRGAFEMMAANFREDACRNIKNVSGAIYKRISRKNAKVLDTQVIAPVRYRSFSSV
jgi:hypothetical protein